MVDENNNPDIPLAEEIDIEHSRNAKTRRVLMILILIASLSAATVWWWNGKRDLKGKPFEKTMSSNLSVIKKSLSAGQSGGLIKKPDFKFPAKVTNLDILKAGKSFYKKGNLNKAEAEFTEGIKNKDHLEMVINNIGVILFSKGKLIESMAMFKKALETDPFFPDAHFNLAYVSEKMGNKNRSFYHYRRFLEFAQERHSSLVRKLKKRMGNLN